MYLQHKVNINDASQHPEGMSLLMICMLGAYADVSEVLLKNGADLQHKDKKGFDVVDWLVKAPVHKWHRELLGYNVVLTRIIKFTELLMAQPVNWNLERLSKLPDTDEFTVKQLERSLRLAKEKVTKEKPNHPATKDAKADKTDFEERMRQRREGFAEQMKERSRTKGERFTDARRGFPNRNTNDNDDEEEDDEDDEEDEENGRRARERKRKIDEMMEDRGRRFDNPMKDPRRREMQERRDRKRQEMEEMRDSEKRSSENLRESSRDKRAKFEEAMQQRANKLEGVRNKEKEWNEKHMNGEISDEEWNKKREEIRQERDAIRQTMDESMADDNIPRQFSNRDHHGARHFEDRHKMRAEMEERRKKRREEATKRMEERKQSRRHDEL